MTTQPVCGFCGEHDCGILVSSRATEATICAECIRDLFDQVTEIIRTQVAALSGVVSNRIH